MTTITDFPAIRPSFLLDFANSGRVDPRVQCTRASTATCFGPDGKLRTVANNVPRIDFDPVTGRCLGLFVEEARTNLVRRSNEFSHADWVQSALVGIGAPDANLMTKLVATTEIRTHELYSATSSIGFADETLLTISVEAKADGANFFWLRCVNKAGSFPSATFNLLTGTASLRGAISSSMKSLGGGVYRCTATFNLGAGASGSAGRTVLALSSGEGAGAEVFAGDGVSGVLFRNVQTEVGATPSSYIPTTTGAATRAAENPQLAELGSWYRKESGTWVVDYMIGERALSGTETIICASHKTENSRLQVRTGVVAARNAAGTQFETVIPATGAARIATTYGGGKSSTAKSGVLYPEANYATPVDAQRLHLGVIDTYWAGYWLNGYITRIAYIPAQLTRAQLQRVSAT